eukprot:scaffold16051_cov31-Prasinocladus_malaysianus.AAC.2
MTCLVEHRSIATPPHAAGVSELLAVGEAVAVGVGQAERCRPFLALGVEGQAVLVSCRACNAALMPDWTARAAGSRVHHVKPVGHGISEPRMSGGCGQQHRHRCGLQAIVDRAEERHLSAGCRGLLALPDVYYSCFVGT